MRFIGNIDIGLVRQKQLHNLGMALLRRLPQRSATCCCLLGIDIGLVRQKKLHNLGMALLRRHKQRSDAVCFAGNIDVGLVRQKKLHNLGMAILRRHPERSDAEAVSDIDVGAGLDQSADFGEIARFPRFGYRFESCGGRLGLLRHWSGGFPSGRQLVADFPLIGCQDPRQHGQKDRDPKTPPDNNAMHFHVTLRSEISNRSRVSEPFRGSCPLNGTIGIIVDAVCVVY